MKLLNKIKSYFRKQYLVKPLGMWEGWVVFDADEFVKMKDNHMSDAQRNVLNNIINDISIYRQGELRPLVLTTGNGLKILVTSMENLEGNFIQ